jgi:hypothetical protein
LFSSVVVFFKKYRTGVIGDGRRQDCITAI